MNNATKNREHWDLVGKDYDATPWQRQGISQITEDLRAHRDWLGLKELKISDGLTREQAGSVRLLDYACGPGIISKALESYITSSVGIDIAPGMVAEYNHRASAAGLEHFHAILGDLCSAEGVAQDLMGKDLFDFDIAGIGMGFHHFEHLQLSIDRIVERLRPGGLIFIVDLVAVSGDHAIGEHGAGDDFVKEAARTVPHKHGFTREDMKALFEAAGCKDFGFVVYERPIVMGEGEEAFTKKVFLAKATKA